MTDSQSILDRLRETFEPENLEWRIQQSGFTANGKPWARIVPYVTNRAIQDRLDDVVGPDRWQNEYRVGPQGGVLCGISLYLPVPDGDEWHWVTKWDGAENTDIEGVKGGLSGSMKRAAVQWGIGRFLYDIGESWAEFVADRTPGAESAEIKSKDGKEKKRLWWKPPTPKMSAPTPKGTREKTPTEYRKDLDALLEEDTKSLPFPANAP